MNEFFDAVYIISKLVNISTIKNGALKNERTFINGKY